MARVTVVGAGVVGLTCAVRLLEDGHRVDVLARDLPLETTSAVAAAIWYPYRALPFDRVLAWSARSYDVFVELADVAGAGVALRGGVEVFAEPQDDPWWRPAVPHLDHVAPPPGYADAWTFLAPVVEMPVYLAWLTSRVDELGGTVTRLNLPALPVGRRRGRQRGRHRRAAAGRGPVGGAGARPGRVRRAGRPRAVVARLVRGPHLRRTPLARHRRRRHRPGGRLEPYAVAGDRRARSWSAGAGWCRRWPGRACSGTGSACGPRARRSGSSGSGDVVHCYGHGGAGVTLELGHRRRGREPWSAAERRTDRRPTAVSGRDGGTCHGPSRAGRRRRDVEQVGVDRAVPRLGSRRAARSSMVARAAMRALLLRYPASRRP